MSLRKESVQIDVEIAGKKAGETLKDLQGNIAQLNRELKSLPIGTEAFNKKAAELAAAKERFAEVQREIRDINKSLPEAGGMMSRFFATVKTGATAVGGAMQKAFYIIEVIKQVYDGIAAFVDLGKESAKVRAELVKLGVEGDENLTKLTAKVQVMAKTSGKEVNEVLRAGNSAAQAFGDTTEYSFAILQRKLVEAGDYSGDFLDTINEYSVHAAKAGFSLEGFANKLIAAEQAGAVNMDKVADQFKEFGIRMNEQTKATSDALAPLGVAFRDKLFKEINDGSLKTEDAYDRVISRMQALKLPANETATILADVFGSQGEDLTLDFLVKLKDVGEGMKVLNKDAELYAQAQLKWQSVQERGYVLIGKIAESVKNFFIELLANSQPVYEVFATIYNEVSALWTEIGKLLEAMGLMTNSAGVAKGVMETLRVVLFGITGVLRLVVNTTAFVVKTFREAYESGGILRTVFDAIGNSVGWLVRKLVGMGEAFAEVFGLDIAPMKNWLAEEEKVLQKSVDNTAKAAEDKRKVLTDAEKLTEEEKAKIQADGEKRREQQAKAAAAKKLEADKIAFAQSQKELANSAQTIETTAKPNLLSLFRLPTKAEFSAMTAALSPAEKKAEGEAKLYGLEQAGKGDSKLALQAKLQILAAERQMELEQANLTREQKLAIERKYNALEQEERKAHEDKKKAIAAEGLSVAKDLMQAGIELAGENTKARRAFGAAYKASAISEVIVNLSREISGYMGSATSILTMGAAGTAKSIFATIRAGIAIAKISAQKFERGGWVGGRPHSEGGTLIEAEKGELVMRKSVAQKYPQLAQLNETGDLRSLLADSVPSGADNSTTNALLAQMLQVMMSKSQAPIKLSVEARVDPRRVRDYIQAEQAQEDRAKF
jgi:phage-related minor tail protein